MRVTAHVASKGWGGWARYVAGFIQLACGGPVSCLALVEARERGPWCQLFIKPAAVLGKE